MNKLQVIILLIAVVVGSAVGSVISIMIIDHEIDASFQHLEQIDVEG